MSEVKIKADEAVKSMLECHIGKISNNEFEKHKLVPGTKQYSYGYSIALKCAILMYEKIVSLAESVDLYFKVDEYKAILNELKSRI